jgi:RND family efflux transporter MFP subunit
MPLWKQTLAALAVVAATLAGWALYVPSAAPVLARLGLPARAAPDPAEAERGGFGGFGGPGGPAIVVGATVGEGPANARVSAIGDGRALRSVELRPLDAGRLVALEVEAGAAVEAGETIARLDSDVEAIALERARLLADDAAATYDRIAQLRARGAATDVQEREARLTLERARLEERDAAVALERRTVLAPIAGVVGLLPTQVGAQVDPDTEIATIEDRTSLLVEFRVPERVVGALRVGDPVTATPLALPELAYQGSVSALDNRIDPDSRTLRVQAALPNADDRLRSGMAFAIEIRLEGEPFPEIDALAIQWGAEGAFVWTARDGRAERLPVRIVQRNADRVLVAADLAPGDRVVVEGVQRLRDGEAVRFVGDPPPAAPEAAGGAGQDVTRAARPVSGG